MPDTFEPQIVSPIQSPISTNAVTIIVLGASGDLAYKKTYPAIFDLYRHGFIGEETYVVGYARSKMTLDDFKKRISQRFNVKENEKDLVQRFLSRCTYVSGLYNKGEDFNALNSHVKTQEEKTNATIRIFYMALPPSVFDEASQMIREHLYVEGATNRLIVEKPFGKDLESSRALGRHLGKLFPEDDIFRIDHYLGKEMVKNIMVLRFANVFLGAVWNRNHIDNIQITFKETIGTDGRGGYFDEFGVIRDVMQNHLLQILSIVAMEKPASLDSEDIRDEKVKVLRCIQPLRRNDLIIGQYTKSADGKFPGYTDDPGVPKDSVTPTYAAAAFNIVNERWDGVPFIVKCGKALDQQKTEIRIQFQDVPGNIYGPSIGRNELVIRVQPKEAVYMKMMNKKPGLSNSATMSELDLSYDKRFKEVKIPDAYEALILDVIKGEKANFVRTDELDAAWKIFTPILHELEEKRIKPELYEYGSRGPQSAVDFIRHYGYRYDPSYQWSQPKI